MAHDSFRLGHKTASDKFRQKAKESNGWLKRIRNWVKLEDWWKVLQQEQAGHYRYCGISGNQPARNTFYGLAIKLAYKWINRRSQRKSMSFGQYSRFLMCHPLPKPKICHSLYTLSWY